MRKETKRKMVINEKIRSEREQKERRNKGRMIEKSKERNNERNKK